MWASSSIMLRNCGSAEIRRQDPLEHDVLLEPLGAVLGGEENLGHPAVGELAQDGVAAM